MTQLQWSPWNAPWNAPWNELDSMQRQLSRIFDGANIGRDAASSRWLPAVDIRETEHALIAAAEVPGIDKKDVKAGINDGVLTLMLHKHEGARPREISIQ